MKLLMLGATALCAGGAAWYMHNTPDFDRVVRKPPAQVYAAFSQLAQQGTVTPPNQPAKGPRISLVINKVDGQSIHYEIRFDQRPAVVADLTFAAAGEDGRQTRLTAELNLDTSALGEEFQTEGGIALSLLQERVIDGQFAQLMDHMADDIEAGRPLSPLRASDMGVREASARMDSDPRVIRARAEANQRAASRPMNNARPMVDPNRAADHYLNGGDRNGGWGR